MGASRHTTTYALGLIGALGIGVWLFPFLRFGMFGFGYDTGLYRRYLLEPFLSIPNTAVPGLDHTVFVPRIALDLVRLAVPNPDMALMAAHILFALLAAFCVYLFARTYLPKHAALIAPLLFVLSAVQFAAFDAFLFKQVVALPFLLLCLLFLERERYFLATLLGIVIVLTHQTTSVLLIVIAAAGFLVLWVTKRKFSIPYALFGTFVSAAYLLFHPHVARKLASPPVSVFLTEHAYVLIALPVLVLAAVGIWRNWKEILKRPVLTGALLTAAALVVFHLPFYSRVYVFLDLFLLVPAALGVSYLVMRVTNTPMRIVCGILLLAACALPLAHRLYTLQPELDPETQAAVSALGMLPPNVSVITSPALMPYAQGWSRARVYAPGLLKEPHSTGEWSLYWSHASPLEGRDFLTSFPAPVYILARKDEAQYIPACATMLQTHLYSAEPCL